MPDNVYRYPWMSRAGLELRWRRIYSEVDLFTWTLYKSQVWYTQNPTTVNRGKHSLWGCFVFRLAREGQKMCLIEILKNGTLAWSVQETGNYISWVVWFRERNVQWWRDPQWWLWAPGIHSGTGTTNNDKWSKRRWVPNKTIVSRTRSTSDSWWIGKGKPCKIR